MLKGMADLAHRLEQNLLAVRERIAAAAARCGRDASRIELVAVTKYVSTEVARALVELGCHHLAESRPQELWRKAETLADPAIRWHMVGHLQRNKARRTLAWLHLLHSLDSLELLAEIDRASSERPVQVLIEVNVSGDATKHGLLPGDVQDFLRHALRYHHVSLRGLMTMAAREGDLACARQNFSDLRALRDQLQDYFGSQLALDELSMGMSGDYEVAIEEGATIVRIGSVLFEGIAT